MKNLNIVFEDDEWEQLVEAKRKSKKIWHDFIMQLVPRETENE